MHHISWRRSDDGIVDLRSLFFKLTFETSMLVLSVGMALAEGWDGEIIGLWSAFAEVFSPAQSYIVRKGRSGQFYWLITDSAFRKASKSHTRPLKELSFKPMSCNSSHKELRRDRIGSAERTDSFVDALLQQTQDPKEL